MASDDSFKRKKIGTPRREDQSSLDDDASLLERRSQAEIFDRETAVPSIPAEEHAKRTMRAQEAAEKAAASEEGGFAEDPARTDEEDRDSALEFELELDSEDSSALGFVDTHSRDAELPPAPPFELDQTAAEADPEDASLSGLYAVGDFSGALEVAERRLEQNPDDQFAQRCANACQDALSKMYTARIGPFDRRLRVRVAPEQIRWLSLDHRAGFLLSLVDGQSNVEEILDMSGMPRLDALRIIAELVDQKVLGPSD